MFTLKISTIVLIATALLSHTLSAQTLPHHRFQKNFKSYAMGGAGVVQHGSVMTMLSNPANLRNLPNHGLEGEFLGTVVGIGSDVLKFSEDLNDANRNEGTEQDKSQRVLSVIDKYTGTSFSANTALTPLALAYHSDFLGIDAQGIALVSSAKFDLRPHNGFGSSGILETKALAYGGFVYGINSNFDSFSVGMNFKFINYYAMEKQFTVAELISSNLSINDYLKKGSSFAPDIGVIWQPMAGDGWSLQTGLSYNNIGGIGNPILTRTYIPATLDLGMRVDYELTSYNPIAFSLDYIDISNAYQDEGDMKKRLNYGVDFRLLRSNYFDLGVQAGMHQAQLTYGGDLILLGFMNFGYASYSEELGVYASQDPNAQSMYYFAISF